MSEHEAIPRTPSAFRYWRIRACRWLWHALGFVWGTLIVGIVIGTIANLNTSTMDTSLAKLYIVHLVQTYPLPVWSNLGLLAALTLLSWLGSRERQATPVRALSEQDRGHMLRRLRARYEQILAQSLQGAVQLELELASRPTAVQNALSLTLRLPDQPEQLLPPRTSIVQAYELAQQELLILGEPGAGKSMLLVELARFLVAEAEQDAIQPLPIYLPLASWAVNRHPLDEWLGEEIAHFYDVSPRLSKQWIAGEQILPLLDGLDEMEEDARPACIVAINTYHREYPRPLAICSRTSEYDAASRHEQLALHTAIVVQPLESKQVDAYLVNLGKPLAGLRAALKTNTLLQELATTPLMLQVLILTYHGTSVRALSQREPQLRKQIWTDYVQRMVRNKGDIKRYPLPVTIGWLRWLASEMRQYSQVVFFLETLQPAWLPEKQEASYQWSLKLFFGLAGGLFFGLASGLLSGLVGGLVGGLIGALISGQVGGETFGGNARIEPTEILTWSWKKFWPPPVYGLLAGLGYGLLSWMGVRLGGQSIGLLAGLGGGLLVGLGGGLLVGFSGEKLTEHLMLSPNEGIHRSLKNGLLFGLLFGLVGGLAGALVGELFFGVDGLLSGLVFGLLFGLVFGLLFGLGATIQHYLLRFWLARSGVFPWRAVPFLEDATARILLRRVGGGYNFANRLFLDYFADLDAQIPMVRGAVQTNSTSVQTKVSTSADES